MLGVGSRSRVDARRNTPVFVEEVDGDDAKQMARLVRSVRRLKENELVVTRGNQSVGNLISAALSESESPESSESTPKTPKTPNTFCLQCLNDTSMTEIAAKWWACSLRDPSTAEPSRGVVLLAPDVVVTSRISDPRRQLPLKLLVEMPRKGLPPLRAELTFKRLPQDPWKPVRTYLRKRAIAFYWWDLLKRLMDPSPTVRTLFPHEAPRAADAGIMRKRDRAAFEDGFSHSHHLSTSRHGRARRSQS